MKIILRTIDSYFYTLILVIKLENIIKVLSVFENSYLKSFSLFDDPKVMPDYNSTDYEDYSAFQNAVLTYHLKPSHKEVTLAVLEEAY